MAEGENRWMIERLQGRESLSKWLVCTENLEPEFANLKLYLIRSFCFSGIVAQVYLFLVLRKKCQVAEFSFR